MPASYRRLRITRDVPAPSAGFMGLPAAPHLFAGDVVLAHEGPAVVGEAEIAAVIEPGGAWFGVPKNSTEEA